MLRIMFRGFIALDDWLGDFFERLLEQEEAAMAFTAACALPDDLGAIAAANAECLKHMHRPGSVRLSIWPPRDRAFSLCTTTG